MQAVHNIAPVFDANAHTLILGSFPSVQSRRGGFFYHHPQNRFWKVLAAVFGAPCPQSIEEKKAFLHANGLALWDVAASCDIEASADSSIRGVVPNGLSRILCAAPIERVFLNGTTAGKLYQRFFAPSIPLPFACLPSTSAANASYSFERLVEAWRILAQEEKRP